MNFYEFYNIINESMDVRIKDADYKNRLDNILNVCVYLENKLYNIINSFTPEQKEYYDKNRVAELISPDGDGAFKTKGIINFYLRPIPPDLINKFIQAIKYYLQEVNIKYAQFYEEDSNSWKNSRVVRIPILEIPKEDAGPPELNLSNINAHLIFNDVLGFKGVDNYHYVISARDLLIKIDNLPDFVSDINARSNNITKGSSGATFMDFGYSGDQIRQRLQKIRQIAIWAIENNYDTIIVV